LTTTSQDTRQKLPKKLETGIIRQNVLIPNSTPEAVYKVLLSSKDHSKFTGSPAKISGRAGSKFTAWGGYISGKNIALTKGKKIEQEWATTEFPEGYGPSILKISLRKKGDGTELSMIHSKVPSSQVKRYDEGWHSSYWDPMKEYFEKMKK
jgi:activator of HSP90 ATPase